MTRIARRFLLPGSGPVVLIEFNHRPGVAFNNVVPKPAGVLDSGEPKGPGMTMVP